MERISEMDVKSWLPKEEAQLQLQPSFIQRLLLFQVHQRLSLPLLHDIQHQDQDNLP